MSAAVGADAGLWGRGEGGLGWILGSVFSSFFFDEEGEGEGKSNERMGWDGYSGL